MKHNRNRRSREDDYEDDDYPVRPKKKESHRRREVRNWTKAWSDYSNTDDSDDFYRQK